MRKILFTTALALCVVGCAAEEPAVIPATEGPSSPAIPEDGLARDLHFAPEGFSVPAEASMVEEIDQVNNITVVFSAPDADAVVDYYRRALPGMGMKITDDANGALQFENGQWQGSVVGGDEVSAITMRTDWER